MAFDLEVTFSGLCLAVIEESAEPHAPSKMDVVCIDAKHHRPRLTFCFDDRVEAQKGREQLVFLGLQGERFGVIELEGKVSFGLGADRSPPAIRTAEHVGLASFDGYAIDRVVSLNDLGVETIKPSADGAVVPLDFGGLVVGRDPLVTKDGRDVLWQLPTGGSVHLVDDLVVRAEVKAPYVTLHEGEANGPNPVLKLDPADGQLLRVCVSNDPISIGTHSAHHAPPVVSTVDGSRSERSALSHLAFYSSIVDEGTLVLPSERDEVVFRTPSSPKCNVARYTK